MIRTLPILAALTCLLPAARRSCATRTMVRLVCCGVLAGAGLAQDMPSLHGHVAPAASTAPAPPNQPESEAIGASFAPAVLWMDMDRDGLQDLLLLGKGAPGRLLWNLGAGTFTEVTQSAGLVDLGVLSAAAWHDAGGDGLPDLVLLVQGEVRLLNNLGGRCFEDVTSLAGIPAGREVRSFSLRDFDADGCPDLQLDCSRGVVLLRNDGHGRFAAVDLGSTARPGTIGGGYTSEEDSSASDDPDARGPGRGREAAGFQRTAGRKVSLSVAPPTGVAPTVLPHGAAPPAVAPTVPPSPVGLALVAQALKDQAGGAPIEATRSPGSPGRLYPLSPELFVDPAGNVGMGTLTPGAHLEVRGGGILLNSVVGNPQFSLDSPDYADIDFYRANSFTGELRLSRDASGATFDFNDRVNGAASRLFIDGQGHVGIGTTSPTESLSVLGAGPQARIRSTSSGVTETKLILQNADRIWEVGQSFGNVGASKFAIYDSTSGGGRFVIDTDGHVGIGVLSPGQTLSVGGTVESLVGGYKFPDQSLQQTAAFTAAGAGLVGSAGTLNVGQGQGIAVAADAIAIDTNFADGRYVNEGQSGAISANMLATGAVGPSALASPMPFNTATSVWTFTTGSLDLTSSFGSNAPLTITNGSTSGSNASGNCLSLVSQTTANANAALFASAQAGNAARFEKHVNEPLATVHISAVSNNLALEVAGQILVDAGGRIGIGKAPGCDLELLNNSACKPVSSAWTVTSDRRLKKNITPIEDSLARLLRLRGVNYEWIDPAGQGVSGGSFTGMIAQEVEAVFPSWVRTNGDGYKTITPIGFEGLVVEALRDLRREKDEQLAAKDAELQALRAEMNGRIGDLGARLERMEALLAIQGG